MQWTQPDRDARRFAISPKDQRTEAERDKDRILYSSAFHRLAGITQIVRAGEQDIFHTRQQHTYKVAQIGRRLAENCIRTCAKNEQSDWIAWHGLDPETVEAACIAHDLGHPPFGHAAETLLDELVRKAPNGDANADGYEGNAQTFRILTKLAIRFGNDNQCLGLDLTRATLAAVLKYPWLRDHDDVKKAGKWSAYKSEADDFHWAREFHPGDGKTAEAELMDWADDIAYSVHDLEDFHRVGVIPWWSILKDGQRDNLITQVVGNWFAAPADAAARMRTALDRIALVIRPFPKVTDEPYDGSRDQRRQLRNFTSKLIGRYIQAAKIAPPESERPVEIERFAEDEVRLLKHLARHYVIGLPALKAQQYGQSRIVADLFEIFRSEGRTGRIDLFPPRLRYIWEDLAGDGPARIAADCVAALTENEAYQLHRRLTGYESGSVLDPIVR
ncbi:UNVERIFIED_ORG: dGTPase [Sphingomonas sp. R1F5B]